MAYEHLRSSLTKENLWLYILSELSREQLTPVELRKRVRNRHGFSPAAITFYAVIYRLRREGLVEKSSDSLRSSYAITKKGLGELERGLLLLERTRNALQGTS